jgi:pimeloyl-ACP methyl ester carboxylesterase
MDLQRENNVIVYDVMGEGIPLLCLSAFPFAGEMWRHQQALADYARLIIPDYRGIGRSTGTVEVATMELLAGDMLAILDQLQIQQAVIAGVSMGAYVAFSIYEQAPERVRALILADTRAGGDTPAAAERRRQTVEGLRAQGTSILRSRVDDLFSPLTQQNNPALVTEAHERVARENAEGLAALMLGMAARPDRTALLPTITVPTLVLCGEDDQVSPPDGMQAMADAIPAAKFRLIPAAGHLSPLEQPGVFNAFVRLFLADL